MSGVPRLRLLALCTCAALLLGPRATAAQEQRAVLELLVNGVPKGEAIVVLRETDALIGVDRLREAGLEGFVGSRDVIGDEQMVSLTSLAGSLTFSVDERDLRLILTVIPALLGESVRSYGSAAPLDMVYRSDTSAFVNYAVNWNQENGTDLFTESAARLGNALLYNTASVGDAGAMRGLTSITLDERRRMRRWVVGDAFAQTGPLGGDAWTGGITVTREFGIEPYFVRYPSLSLSAPVAVPSTVEVHVNGRIVSQEQVAPGRLDMRDLPLTVGRNDARIVVRDAFGGSREISANYYLASSVLAPGVHDYQYSLGFRRESIGTSSWDYKEPVALARHRVGLTDTITVGARAEAASDLFSLGPSVNFSLPFGEVEAAAAVSGGREGRGAAMLAGYTFAGRPVSLGASLLAATAAYTTLSARPQDERSSTEVSVFGGVPIGPRVSLTAQHNRAVLHDGVSRSRSALLTTVHISRNVQLVASGARIGDENGRSLEAFTGLSVLFGRTTTSMSVARNHSGTSVGVEAQQPLPVGVGYGYHARAESGTPGSFAGALRYQGRYGRYELRRDVIGQNGASSASVAGSVVAIGGGLFASRPVQQSFALVRVPGVEGVRGFASNQEVGRTNAAGNLLVPDLQPYYGNLLNISDSDVPLQYSVDGVRLTLALPYRGGALALFPVQLIRRVTGTIRVGAGAAERVPEYGELRVTPVGASEPIVSPVGSTGEFYFENLADGRHQAAVQDDEGTCTFVLEVPESDEPFLNLGTIRCVPPEVR